MGVHCECHWQPDQCDLTSDGTYNYLYDANGNMTKKTTIATGDYVSYTWDYRNRLTDVKAYNSSNVLQSHINFVYDVFDRLIEKQIDPTGGGTYTSSQSFIYDGNNVVLAYNGSGTLTDRFLIDPDNSQVIADENGSGTVSWYLQDREGTTGDVIQYDAATDTTTVVDHLTYGSFGNITAQTNSAYQPLFAYTGQMWDADAGLYYDHARWYDAQVGRFISQDPTGFAAGDSNLYRYVENSPTNFIDPSGRIMEGAGAVVGAGVGMMAGMMRQGMQDMQDAARRAMNQMMGASAVMGARVALGLANLQRFQMRDMTDFMTRALQQDCETNLEINKAIAESLTNSMRSIGLGIVAGALWLFDDPRADELAEEAYRLGPRGQTTGAFHVGVDYSIAIAEAAMKRALQLMAVQAVANMVHMLADSVGIANVPLDGCGANPLDRPCFVAGTPVLVAGNELAPLTVAGDDPAVEAVWYLIGAGIGIGLVLCEGGLKHRPAKRGRRRGESGVDDGTDWQVSDDEDPEDDMTLERPSSKINVEEAMPDLNTNGKFVFEFTGANRVAPAVRPPGADPAMSTAESASVAGEEIRISATDDSKQIRFRSGRVSTQQRPLAAQSTALKPKNCDVARQHREKASRCSRWPRFRMVTGILIAIACIGRGLWGSAHNDTAQLDRRAATATQASGTRYVAIENIRVGDRVLTNGPFGPDAPSKTAVDPLTWRRLRLETVAFSEDGTRDVIDVDTLQSPDWIARHSARVGATVPLPVDAVEMGFASNLQGTVVSDEQCPPLKPGAGRLVQMTVNHLNRNVLELSLRSGNGRTEKLRPTAYHKFYSESRSTWVSAEDLRDGERLRGTSGVVTVVGRTRIPGVHRVYNMTVEGDHVYRVSNLGVLVHNDGCLPPAGPNSSIPLNDRGNLPAVGPPDSSQYVDYGNGNGTIRDYGPTGGAQTDYDFGHNHGAGDPHAHDWDWGNDPARGPGRPLSPGE